MIFRKWNFGIVVLGFFRSLMENSTIFTLFFRVTNKRSVYSFVIKSFVNLSPNSYAVVNDKNLIESMLRLQISECYLHDLIHFGHHDFLPPIWNLKSIELIQTVNNAWNFNNLTVTVKKNSFWYNFSKVVFKYDELHINNIFKKILL